MRTKVKNFALRSMENSKQYDSVPVKDTCTQFSLTFYFQGRAILLCRLNSPLTTPGATPKNFGTKNSKS